MGPVGYLLQSLGNLGFKAREGFQASWGALPFFSILDSPKQELRRDVTQADANRALSIAARTRGGYVEGDVDMGALAKLRKGLDPAQRRQLIMIQAGAVWESSVLTKFIHQREPECKLCGCGQGVHHMLWECPHTAATERPCALAAAAAHCAPPMLMERLIPCHPVGPGDRPGWGGPRRCAAGSPGHPRGPP